MIAIAKQSFIAALLAASIAGAPANAQVRSKPVLAPTGPVKPPRQVEPEAPTAPTSAAPKAVLQKKIKAAYYCTIETVTKVTSFGDGHGDGEKKTETLTLTANDDGGLVYGGDWAGNPNARYHLLRWVEGKEPKKGLNPMSNTKSTGWIISPRIHQSTGEYISESWAKGLGLTMSIKSTGTCSGNV
jgi:hypothetical protein